MIIAEESGEKQSRKRFQDCCMYLNMDCYDILTVGTARTAKNTSSDPQWVPHLCAALFYHHLRGVDGHGSPAATPWHWAIPAPDRWYLLRCHPQRRIASDRWRVMAGDR